MDESYVGQQCIKSKLNALEEAGVATQNISGNNHQPTHQAYNQHIVPTERPTQQHLVLHLFLPVSKIIYFSF